MISRAPSVLRTAVRAAVFTAIFTAPVAAFSASYAGTGDNNAGAGILIIASLERG